MSDAAKPQRFDPSSARQRRHFYLSRAVRSETHGSGSDLTRLLERAPQNHVDMPLLDDLRIMLIGAHAASAYAPERATSDVDFLVHPEDIRDAEMRLEKDGWKKTVDLVFPGSKLGLRGGAWANRNNPEIDLITSDEPWLLESFTAVRVDNADGKRVIPRPYLILMKLDSARGIDQGDLTRILGRLSNAEVDEIVRIVRQHNSDETIADDIRQYAEIGRWEYDSARKPTAGDPKHE